MARALRLPASFRPTHQTAGLAGFPAIDVFGAAGTPVLAPSSGQLVDVHMIPWNLQQRVGGETAYLQGADGKTYFLTHLAGNVPTGEVSAGQPIGTVAAVPQDAWASHIHEGAYQGLYNPGGTAPVTSTLVSATTSADQLNAYLRQQGSPLAGLGAAFVAAGQRSGVDPRLLVAISGGESSFGKYGPSQGIHNPFGYGPNRSFPSYGAAINAVAQDLGQNYIGQGLTTIPQIAAKWAPVGASNDPTNLNANWIGNVGRYYSQLGGTTPGRTLLSATTGGSTTATAPTGPPPQRIMVKPTQLPAAVQEALSVLRNPLGGPAAPSPQQAGGAQLPGAVRQAIAILRNP